MDQPSDQQSLIEWTRYTSGVYQKRPLAIVRGQGTLLVDAGSVACLQAQ